MTNSADKQNAAPAIGGASILDNALTEDSLTNGELEAEEREEYLETIAEAAEEQEALSDEELGETTPEGGFFSEDVFTSAHDVLAEENIEKFAAAAAMIENAPEVALIPPTKEATSDNYSADDVRAKVERPPPAGLIFALRQNIELYGIADVMRALVMSMGHRRRSAPVALQEAIDKFMETLQPAIEEAWKDWPFKS